MSFTKFNDFSLGLNKCNHNVMLMTSDTESEGSYITVEISVSQL